MANDTLTLLQVAVRKRGGNLANISPAAEDLCRIIDHWNTLHWNDRNRYGEEIKKLRELIAKLEKDEA